MKCSLDEDTFEQIQDTSWPSCSVRRPYRHQAKVLLVNMTSVSLEKIVVNLLNMRNI